MLQTSILVFSVEVSPSAGKSNSVWMNWQIKYVRTKSKQSVVDLIEKQHSGCQFSPRTGLFPKLRLLFKFQVLQQYWKNFFCLFQIRGNRFSLYKCFFMSHMQASSVGSTLSFSPGRHELQVCYIFISCHSFSVD